MSFFKMRFRHSYMILASLLVVALFLLTDPQAGLVTKLPFGASTVVYISVLLKAVWSVAFLHVSRRALFDYLDLSVLFDKAQETPDGAGKALIFVGLAMISIAILVLAATLG